ncbi:MAG TPA: hypothetical protein ENN98_08120 [Desulfurivibrio alkaliphilus]|uniref:PP-loop domain protein n=1 Tax=Desulfurivibrio alkaliphilus TaxID=427923 RepID=A0A7C2XHV8_9BACT|nr:hypothetical protein [Desulfurivibrio alkaliphilus]
MNKQELAILFSGGTDSLAVYALAAVGHHPELPRPVKIHLLHMLNGMSRFHNFPRERFDTARRILATKVNRPETMPDTEMMELDMGRLFQGLWLDRFEELMPRYNGKNLVCVACKIGMHTKAILYCVEHLVPLLATGYARRQDYYPEQTPIFMDKIAELSARFGIRTIFPVFDDFDDQQITRHVLEDFGLPSTGGGERKCLFCQTLTTATPVEIENYLDDMIPLAAEFIDHKLHGRIREAAAIFPPGRV